MKWITVGNGMPENYETWQKKINEYLAEKINVKVDVEVNPWGDWDNRRAIVKNTGTEFDILFTDYGRYTNAVNLGVFADITKTVEEQAKSLKEFIPEQYWTALKVNDKLYGIPTYKDSSVSLFVNWDKKYVDEFGIDENSVKKLSDMTPFLEKIKEKTGEPSFVLFEGGAYHMIHGYDLLGTGLKAMGVRYDDKDAKVVPVFEQEDIMERYKTVHQWYKDGIINQDAVSRKETAGEYRPVMIAKGWAGAAKTIWGPNMGMESKAFQLFDTILSNETAQGSVNAVSANSKHIEEAVKLLETVNMDSYVRDSFFYGEEGKNWEYTEDKKVHILEQNFGMAGYTQGTFFNVTQTDDVDFNQWDEVKELNEKAVVSPSVGFTFNKSKEVEDKLLNCIEIFERFQGELFCGVSDPEVVVPKMMEKLRSAGLDDIIAEAQKQVDEFMASK